MSIPEQTLFGTACQALSTVIGQIGAEDWDRKTTPSGGFPGRIVREVVASHAKENRWVGHVLAGGTIEDGTTLYPEYPADLSGPDAVSAWHEVTATAASDVLALDDPSRPVHLSFGSFGDFTARDYLQQVITYHGFETFDLARLLGLDSTLPSDLVAGLTVIMSEVAEQWRTWGVFGPEVTVSPDANAQAKLLALSGRTP
ncbi:hypothetical protein [Pseudonocardia spinosispora]|uniref:hypothetical protein n=1 Tax=Pseudonocardia spinosispora TaxID=103441 RepID=UPI0012EBA1F4|nr:hypothetical protein [Pseudonocardia spinosispora]